MRKIPIHCSTLFIMIGIMVSFFAFLNGMDLFWCVKAAINEANEFRYESEIVIRVSDHPNNKELLKKLEDIPGNIKFAEYLVYLDKEKNYHLSDIIIKQDEDIMYPLVKGRFPKSGSKKEVTIGKEILPYCTEKEGEQYLEIEGEEYLVVGIVGGAVSNALDGKVILSYNSLDSVLQNRILNQGEWEILCSSNQQDLEPHVKQFCSRCLSQDKPYYMDYEALEQRQKMDVKTTSESGSFYWAICGFAIVNCIVVSEFWILRRKQEMLVRKIWGYTNFQIFLLMFKELICISGVTVGIGWIIQILVVKLLGSGIGISLDINKFWMSILFIVMTALLIVFVPTYKVFCEFPCENLEV